MIKLRNRYLLAIAIVLLMIVGSIVYGVSGNLEKNTICRECRSQLSQLSKYSDRRLFYRDSLKHVLDSTMLKLHKDLSLTDSQRYEINKQGLQKSLMFSFDYASQFATKIMIISDRIGDPNRIVESRAMASFYLSQACLFVEALKSLQSVNPESDSITDQIRSKYYFCHAIYYQRMAVYVKDSINTNKYNRLGEEMFRKCIQYTSQPGIRYFAEGRIKERANDMSAAQQLYEKALNEIPQDDYVLKSFTLSSLAKAYKHQGKHNQALPYYMKATELDILHSLNSSIAIIDLTEHLYNHYGNTKEASKFLEMAIDNGEFYGMRSQITRVDRMVPALSDIKEKERLSLFIGAVCILAILLIILIMVIFRYRHARLNLERFQSSDTQNTQISNRLLEENNQLNSANNQLVNSNRIKNEYIGTLMESNSELAIILGDFTVKAQQKLKTKQYDQLQKMLCELETRLRKKEQMARFDEVFVSIYPEFIGQFNALLKPDKQEKPIKGALTPCMRIFALVCLGLTDNHQIARVLNYSYNTILNYRVRTRGNALKPETFEDDIKLIGC